MATSVIINTDGDEIEIESPIAGWHVYMHRKMTCLSDHPEDAHDMSYAFSAYLVNPSDAPGKYGREQLFVISFGMVHSTNFLVWARGFEDALEEAAEAAFDAGMKGFFVDNEHMKELYDEAREELGPDAEDDDVAQQAEADMTYTESGWIGSDEWGGQDVHPGAKFGDGGDLYAATKAVSDAYSAEPEEELEENVRGGRRDDSRVANLGENNDYLVARRNSGKFYLYSFNAWDGAVGSLVGKAIGYASEEDAFRDAQRFAMQRDTGDAVVVRENADKSTTQIGNVGTAHRSHGSYNPNARGAPVDETAATELDLYISNTYELVAAPNSIGQSIKKNLEKKIAKGTFDPELSVKAWEYLVEAGAKAYAKEFGEAKDWHTMFSPATRRYVAQGMAKEFAEGIEREVKPLLGRLPAKPMRHNPGEISSDRVRKIVKLAASKTEVEEAKTWLGWDERGTWEKSASDYLASTMTKSAELGMSEADQDNAIADRLVYEALTAIRSRSVKGRRAKT